MKNIWKNLIAAGAIILAIAVIVLCTDIQTVEEYYSSATMDTAESGTVSVSLTVECSAILSNDEYSGVSLSVPTDGVILSTAQYDVSDDCTVYELTLDALKLAQVQFDYTGGTAESVYVKGIANIYEYEYGELSGWMYCVNGEYPQVACSEYTLSDGDTVVWRYTCDLGRDLGDNYSAYSTE